ncbi:2027_t:CDS:1, partial [Paraglomus occultum]
FIVNATSQPLTTTAYFGNVVNITGLPVYQTSCPTGELIAQVLSPSDLQVFLDPTTTKYNITIESMS